MTKPIKHNIEDLYDSLFPAVKDVVENTEQHVPLLSIYYWNDLQWEPFDFIPLHMEDEVAKALTAALIRRLRESMPPSLCAVMVQEAYLVERPIAEGEVIDLQKVSEELAGRVAQEPGAKEVLVMAFFGQGFDYLSYCEIKRLSATTRTLAKGDLIDPKGMVGGRFFGPVKGGEHGPH